MKSNFHDQAIELVMRLMAIPGSSGKESEVAKFIIEQLVQMGVDSAWISQDTAHRKSPVPGEIGNLIVRIPGDKRKPRVMLSAHMDTVPICVGCKPKLTGDSIRSADNTTGLGADDRAGIAAVLTAVKEAKTLGVAHAPLTLCFFVQEEIGLQGSRNLTVSKLGKPTAAYNFDGGDPFKLTIGATGGERMSILLKGVPAHAGLAPEEGASAITAAALAIAELHRGKWLGKVKKGAKLGTSNVGVLRGGNATNVVCESVEVQAEARSHDGAFRLEIADAIENAFQSSAAKVRSKTGVAVEATVKRRVDYESFKLEETSPIVVRAKEAIEAYGKTAKYAVTNGGVDANWLVKHGIPTVTLGCGQRDVHTNQESLFVPDFIAACSLALELIQ